MLNTCSTEDFSKISDAFHDDKIIFTESGVWESLSGVFLFSDDLEAPGTEIIRSSVSDLTLWRKIGIAERPTADLALKWLSELPSGKPLPQDESRRVKALLARHPFRVWEECGHWLNLEGEWTPVESIKYCVSMQSLVKHSHLFPRIKQSTGDFTNLPIEILSSAPFSYIRTLSECIENRPRPHSLRAAVKQPWLDRLGFELTRIELDNEQEQERIRTLGSRLMNTLWQKVGKLEVTPFLEETPAGEPTTVESAWIDRAIYVVDKPASKIARALATELGKTFRRDELTDAIKLCFERDPEFVSEYMNENFRLAPEAALASLSADTTERASSGRDRDYTTTPPEDHRETSNGDRDVEKPIYLDEDNVFDDEEDSDEFGEAADEDWDDDEDDEWDDEFEDEGTSQRAKPAKRNPAKPSLIERFAALQGYRKDGEDRFYHPNGSWIAKTRDSIGFQWERHARDGHLETYYWVKEHCLEKEPLQIEAQVWELLANYPDLYSLLLVNPEGEPVEISGKKLDELKGKKTVRLHAAMYRIVYSQ
jgi:hypothetical protein